MNKETIKELRERADGMITAGIANKDALFAALPLLTELQAKAESARKNLAASVKALTMLSELCSRYALAHESVFEKKRLITNQQGVRTGDIVTDEATYHFASGYDGYVRSTPDTVVKCPECGATFRVGKALVQTKGEAAGRGSCKAEVQIPAGGEYAATPLRNTRKRKEMK